MKYLDPEMGVDQQQHWLLSIELISGDLQYLSGRYILCVIKMQVNRMWQTNATFHNKNIGHRFKGGLVGRQRLTKERIQKGQYVELGPFVEDSKKKDVAIILSNDCNEN